MNPLNLVTRPGRTDIQDKLHGLRIGVDDYMTKPFEVEELLLRIADWKNPKIGNLINISDSNTWIGFLPMHCCLPPVEKMRPVERSRIFLSVRCHLD